MQRRDFIKLCAAGAGTALSLPSDAAPRHYARARLVDDTGKVLRASTLAAERNFIFHYPYAATPCFLLNLGRPVRAAQALSTSNAEHYRWPGGVGPAHSIVAYSAICAHQLAYPTREISFISYRSAKSERNRHARVIHCCAEHSQYDPAAGGRVLAGPAPQPLAAVLLDYEPAEDALYATGTLGGEMFNAFFEKYRFRLALEHQGRERHAVQGSCRVSALETYCRQQVQC